MFFLFLSLSTFFIHHFHSYMKILTVIPHIPTLISRIPTLIPFITTPISRVPTLIPCIRIIPTLIPRIHISPTLIPCIPIIPLIPFLDSPLWHLQITVIYGMEPRCYLKSIKTICILIFPLLYANSPCAVAATWLYNVCLSFYFVL